jgi:transposase-like protein
MLKEPEISRYSRRQTHRTYTAQFKAELVAACQTPSVSVAGLAAQHGMNANVLHRWLKEHHNEGRHKPDAPCALGSSNVPAFIALPVCAPTTTPEPKAQDIRLELRKGALTMVVSWPVSAASDFANWTSELLK